MNLSSHPDRSVVRTALDEIIHAHGFWPVLKALLARTFRRAPPSLGDVPISNHLRRDIGLPPVSGHDRHAFARW